MTVLGPETVLGVFVLFCRIGATMMLMPGTSSSQIPAQVRLFLAVAVSLALAPLLVDTVRPAIADERPAGLLWLIGGELLIGLFIGLLARAFFIALQALATVLANAIGFSGIPGSQIEETEPVPAIVSLITVSAVVLMSRPTCTGRCCEAWPLPMPSCRLHPSSKPGSAWSRSPTSSPRPFSSRCASAARSWSMPSS